MTKVLKNAGFDKSLPTFFAILGVTYYLTLPVFEQTIEKISRISVCGNRLVFDFPDETTFDEKVAERVYRLTQPMVHGFTVAEIRRALSRHGFAVTAHETPKIIQKHFFENRAEGQTAFENIHFMLAEKKEIKQ